MEPRFPFFVATFASLAVGFVLWARAAPQRVLAELEEPFGGIRAGDWVFQDLECGPRCALIRDVTQSRYVHVGIVTGGQGGEHGTGGRVVWEAYNAVGPIPLHTWTYRGVDHQVAVYRPPEALLGHAEEVARALEAMRGRPYDGDYQWDDERIYCSELIVKSYAAAGVDIVAPHTVDLGDRAAEVRRRTGGRLTSMTRMVTPRDLLAVDGVTRVVDPLETPRPGGR